MRVGILDIGGNTASIWYALERLGHKAAVVKSVKCQDALVIPGQGRFDIAVKKLTGKMREEISTFRGPVIGICLGMQLLFAASAEGEGAGLGVFSGKLHKLPVSVVVPHIGWSKCSDNEYYYFAHSYYVPANGQGFKRLVCRYNEVDLVASCQKGNFVGCQFHPEKSSKAGHRFLEQCLSSA